jgi:hypothetical protein
MARPPKRRAAGAGQGRKGSVSSKAPWFDDELRHSVEVYLLLLRMQLQGMDEKFEAVAQALLGDLLTLRNDAAIRYRMRNISAVIRELGGPILDNFSPAESVGNNVRPRIKRILLERADFNQIIKSGASLPELDRQNAIAALTELRRKIEEIERELYWVGHNHPPSPIDYPEIDRSEFQETLPIIDAIQAELEKPEPDVQNVDRSKSRLLQLGSVLAKWIAERTTKFTDAALLAAAPLAVAKISGLLPVLINAVEAIVRTIGH